MKIVWNKVTRFSQAVAIVLALAIFGLAFNFGRSYERNFILGAPTTEWTHFACAEGKIIDAQFYNRFVHLEFGKQKTVYLQQTISGSGARYANSHESLVFWNKGNTAFITEGDQNNPTYSDCVADR
jgi:membrane-bound inhibitor of C-type lysozyme